MQQFNLAGHLIRVEDVTSEATLLELLHTTDAPDEKLFSDDELRKIRPPIYGCRNCGQEVPLALNNEVTQALSACPFPNGVPLQFFLNIPSGEMVVCNDLRDWWPAPQAEGGTDWRTYDIGTRMGMANTSLAYAHHGMAHCFVGNSCPSIYRLSEDHYSIANGGYDLDSDQPKDFPGERVGGIITDLWWYSIVDHDDWKVRNIPDNLFKDGWSRHIIPVKPGLYFFNHYTTLASFKDDYRDQTIYTDVTWASPPVSKKPRVGILEGKI